MFLKVSPLWNVIRFRSVEKLAARFVGPFPIIERIGTMAYKVELPERLAVIHNVFHVSQLRKCLHESAEVVEPSILKEVEVEREATVRSVPTRTLGMEVKKLRNRGVMLVKVQWSNAEEDATWETEAKIRAAYPFLFKGTSLITFSLSSFKRVSTFLVYLLGHVLYP